MFDGNARQVGRARHAAPLERRRLAALTADMLDEGSGDRSAIDINAAFARIGAHLDIDVSADGQRFVIPIVTSAEGPSIVVVQNWEALLPHKL